MKTQTMVREYLIRKWEYLGKIGWQPKCGKEVYIRRNTPYVLRNLQDNPDYLKKNEVQL